MVDDTQQRILQLLDTLSFEVATLSVGVAEHRKETAEHRKETAEHRKETSAHWQEMVEFRQETRIGFKRVELRLGHLETLVESIEGRLVSFDQRITALER